MNTISLNRPSAWPRITIAVAAVAVLSLIGSVAMAGECPADKRVADGQGQKAGPTMPVGVTDVVRSSTDLSKEPAAIAGRQFRLRQLDMQPGAIVPWHSHNERPAMIYIVSGEVIEYASNCAVPITHRAGDVPVFFHQCAVPKVSGATSPERCTIGTAQLLAYSTTSPETM